MFIWSYITEYHQQQIQGKMQPTTSTILINFQGANMTVDQQEYHNQVYSAIRLKLDQMSEFEQINRFTTCAKCNMALTKQDKDLVFYWEQIDTNRANFKQEDLKKIQDDPYNNVIWICRFCNKKNVVEKSRLFFAPSACRVVERPAAKDAKNEPIILIVFDTSGSMEEVLLDQKKEKGDKTQAKLNKLKQQLKGTQIYKKIVAQEQKTLNQFITNQKLNFEQFQKQGYEDHLKKNKLLMSLTELAIDKLTNDKQKKQPTMPFGTNKYSNQKHKNPKSKTIGFVFFNNYVYLQLDGKKVVTVHDQDDYGCKAEHKVRTDFQSFNKLFEVGQEFGKQYSTSLANFKFNDLDLSVNNPQGQTALGPAIMIALGIISKHGPGSSIFVVTDGIANKGIFEQTRKWQQQYTFLKMKLERCKGFLAILEWKDVSSKSPKMKQKQKMQKVTTLDSFCKINQNSVAQKIDILFNQSCNQNVIQGVQDKVEACVNRQNVCWVNHVEIKCQNPNITYEESVKALNSKAIDYNKLYHINPKFNQKKFTQKDYTFPFMTQILIKYENTETRQQSIFMSYIIQKLVKFDKMRKKDKKSLDNQQTLISIVGYLHAEQFAYSIQNISMTIVQQSFRQSIGQKTLRFTIDDSEFSKKQVDYDILQKNKQKSERRDWNQLNKQQDKQPIPFLSSLCQPNKHSDIQIVREGECDDDQIIRF